MLMKYIFHPNLKEYVPTILQILKEGRNQPDFLSFFEAFLLYLFNYINQEHHDEVIKKVYSEFPIEGENVMPTIADKFIQQGLEQGRKQGREEGLEEGLVKMIQKLVRSKFHDFPSSLQEKITSIHDLSTLEKIMDLAIESESLAQFQKEVESILSP